jgi:hypothetical protein
LEQNVEIFVFDFSQKNLNYHFANDFNGDGEFHAVLTTLWAKQREEDPTFASGIGTSTFDMNGDFKIREQFRSGKFNPFSMKLSEAAYKDRLKYAVYCLGRYFLCRGRGEIAYCEWKQVKFHEGLVNGEVEEYVEVVHSFDKSHKLTITNTTARDVNDQVSPRIYANPTDDLCPYRFMKFLRSLCAPTQVRVLCCAGNKTTLNLFRAGKVPYIYNEKLNLGVNTIGPLCKEMAEEMGFEDWEKCTGHGLRKMGITHAMTYAETNIAPVGLGASRHKSYQTSLRYQKPNDDMYMAYNKAICGRHVLSPPKQVRNKRQKKGKAKEPNNNSEVIDDDNHFINEFNDATAVSYGSGTTSDLREDDTASIIKTISTDDNRKMLSTMDSKPEVIQTRCESSISSGQVSSMSGTNGPEENVASASNQSSEYTVVGNNDLAMIPNYPPRSSESDAVPNISVGTLQPYYNMQSNNIQRNFFLHPTVGGVLPSTTNFGSTMIPYNPYEERRYLENKVTELELRLAHQKEQYDEMKQDLRNVKNEGRQKGDKNINGL